MTSPLQPAVLFLDVDGTLIPFQRRTTTIAAVTADNAQPPAPEVNPLLSRLDPAHGPRLLALGCQLVWATSWMGEANEEISPRLGLPALAVVAWSDEDAVTGRLHWKTRKLVTWAAGRTFVWIDDEITEADRTWVQAHHPGDALLHRVDPGVGLTDSYLTVIEHWLALRGQLIVPVSELARRVQHLLDELCVDLGLCLPPVARDRLCHEPPLDPDAIVDAVFRAEGFDPHPDARLRHQVKGKVTHRMPDIVSAYRSAGR